jgi:hypothetical protein
MIDCPGVQVDDGSWRQAQSWAHIACGKVFLRISKRDGSTVCLYAEARVGGGGFDLSGSACPSQSQKKFPVSRVNGGLRPSRTCRQGRFIRSTVRNLHIPASFLLTKIDPGIEVRVGVANLPLWVNSMVWMTNLHRLASPCTRLVMYVLPPHLHTISITLKRFLIASSPLPPRLHEQA